MREDFYEEIEKLLPRGFFIVYIAPDGSYRYSASNPENDPEINDMVKLFLEEEGLND